MEKITITLKDKEESKTVKAILKALKVQFEASQTPPDALQNAESVVEGYKEALNMENGNIERKSYASFKDIFNEL